jgi:hypothetical protein
MIGAQWRASALDEEWILALMPGTNVLLVP